MVPHNSVKFVHITQEKFNVALTQNVDYYIFSNVFNVINYPVNEEVFQRFLYLIGDYKYLVKLNRNCKTRGI